MLTHNKNVGLQIQINFQRTTHHVFATEMGVFNSARTIATIKTTKMADNTMVVSMSSEQQRHNDDPFPVEYVSDSTDRSLNNNDSQRLMNLIRQHKILYECSNSHEQRVKESKDEAWRQISIDFGGDIPTWELARRYKNIRTAFGRFLRRSIKRQDGSIRYLEKSSWGFLAWLKPYIKHKFDYDEESYSSIVDNKVSFQQQQQQQTPSFAVFHSRSPNDQNRYIKPENDVITGFDSNNAVSMVVVGNQSSSSNLSTGTIGGNVEINNSNLNCSNLGATSSQQQLSTNNYQTSNNNATTYNSNNNNTMNNNQQSRPNTIPISNSTNNVVMTSGQPQVHQHMQQQFANNTAPSRRKRTIQDLVEEAARRSEKYSKSNSSNELPHQQHQQQQQYNDDEDSLFLRSLIPQLQRVRPQMKFEVKSKIMKVLHDAEFNHQSSTDQSKGEVDGITVVQRSDDE